VNQSTARNRIVFLDWLRGLAAVVMLQGHTFGSFITPDLRDHPVYIFSQFFGGQAAAIFLFLTGITYGMGMNRREQLPPWRRVTAALKRARYLFTIAVLFRLQMWLFGWPNSPWTDLLKVDVLNLMGATAALLAVLALYPGIRRFRMAMFAGVALAALAPVMSGLETNGWPGAIRDYFVPSTSSFSIFPWGSYLAFGLAAGSAIPLVERGGWSRVMQWAALCGFGLIVAGRYFSNLPYSIYPNSDFWLDSPALIVCKQGVTLLLGAAAFLWTEHFSAGWSWMQLLGRTSLPVYWVHVELVYGWWFGQFKERLGVWECLAASAVLVALMVAMSFAIKRLPWRKWFGEAVSAARQRLPKTQRAEDFEPARALAGHVPQRAPDHG
jgi:uncharacterized membrane protein